jgi:hypothetical protein
MADGGRRALSAALTVSPMTAADARPSPWSRFRSSPFLPATVVALIIATAAGLFAGSYCFALANPTPHRLPMGVIGTADRGPQLISALEQELDASLELHTYPDQATALQAVDRQQVFAVLRLAGDRGAARPR